MTPSFAGSSPSSKKEAISSTAQGLLSFRPKTTKCAPITTEPKEKESCLTNTLWSRLECLNWTKEWRNLWTAERYSWLLPPWDLRPCMDRLVASCYLLETTLLFRCRMMRYSSVPRGQLKIWLTKRWLSKKKNCRLSILSRANSWSACPWMHLTPFTRRSTHCPWWLSLWRRVQELLLVYRVTLLMIGWLPAIWETKKPWDKNMESLKKWLPLNPFHWLRLALVTWLLSVCVSPWR